MVIIVHWTLIVVPLIALVSVAVILGLILYLKRLTRHDLYRSKDGNVYKIIDL